MISRHLMWANWCKEVCIVQIRCFADNLEKRILPTFESVSEEGNRIAEEAWKRFNESAGPDSDMESGAEWASNQGFTHYRNLEDLQQGLLNFSAAFCYHLFEQQLLFFHRKELLKPQEENNKTLFKPNVIIKKFKEHGIAIKDFRSWLTIDELRQVANVVKHADGDAAERVKKLRPEMFTRPHMRDDEVLGEWFVSNPLPVYQPLFGEDFYVTIEDIRAYVMAVTDFWTELADILEQQQ